MVTIALLAILTGSTQPAYGSGYESVKLWSVMPEPVVTWMSQTGLKAAHDGENWSVLRVLADDLIARPDLTIEQGFYLRLAIVRSGWARPLCSDTAELERRVKLVNEAESLALAAPGEHHQALGLVYEDLAVLCRMVGDWSQNLRAEKNLVERFHDVQFAIGAPKYWPTLANTLSMPDYFAYAGESPEDAVAYLKGLARQHPVREFRFAALLALGRQYALMNKRQNVKDIVGEVNRDFADLKTSKQFEVYVTDLRFFANGKGHAVPANGACCGGRH